MRVKGRQIVPQPFEAQPYPFLSHGLAFFCGERRTSEPSRFHLQPSDFIEPYQD
jgi:hypothetical protein